MRSKKQALTVGASAVLVGVPLAAGASVLGAGPAYAAGPVTKQRSVQSQFINNQGQTVNCTLTVTLITNDPNRPREATARWAITNSAACRNAGLSESLSWTTPNGGSAGSNESWNANLPASFQDVYEPVKTPTTQVPNFREGVSVSFNTCAQNCGGLSLALTADSKA